MLTPYQQQRRDRFLAAPVMPAPSSWRLVLEAPVGGLQGIGFAADPISGNDLVMVVSLDGHGLFDAFTGEKIARDRDPDPDSSTPDADPDLACPGLGPLAGQRIRIAGLFGGDSHATMMTAGPSTSSAPTGPMIASCSPPTAAATKGRPEGTGGTSSTPTTPSFAQPASRRQGGPWPSPPVVT